MPNDPTWKPLFRPDRNTGANAGQPVDEVGGNPMTLDAMKSGTYQDIGSDAGLCANIDNDPHGAVHVNVGNQRGMGRVPWAANDPIFWLHHSNIDRIWASWNKVGGKNPTDPGFLNESFVFADKDGKRATITVGELIDATPKSYVYDAYLPRPPGSAPFPPGPALAFSFHVANSVASGPVKLSAARTTVALDTLPLPGLSAPKGTNVLSAQARAPGRRFNLRLEDVQAASDPGIGYDVYLNLPAGTAPGKSDVSYVGSLNFFAVIAHVAHAAHAASPGARSARNFSFDVTEVMQKLDAAGRLAAVSRVTLVPTGKLQGTPTATIGRVAIIS
jgi:tyrosinase